MQKMKSLARSYVWWPQMDSDIESTGIECSDCQTVKHRPAQALLQWPKQPSDRLHLDHAGPFCGRMILVIVDAYSKWIEGYVSNTSTSSVTIEHLMQCFSTHSLPKTLVADNATTFSSDEFKQFTTANGIRLIFSAPYHAASNGLAERAVQTVKQGLKKMNGGSLASEIVQILSKISSHAS